jgi:alkanesulfonate monooxygenase
MSIDFYWRIPTHGCSSSIRELSFNRGDWSPLAPGNQAPGWLDSGPDGTSYLDHMAEIARAAELSGFVGGLLPSFPMTDDPWSISSALARATKAFRFMIAFQPGFLDPVRAARMSASLQRATNGRVVYNIITGGGGPAQRWWGDTFEHDDRYGRTTEFLDVMKGVWKQGPYSHKGRFYEVANGALPPALATEDIPEIYFSGSSEAALQSAARHADFYLSWLEPMEQLRAKFAQVKQRTAEIGRGIKCAIRVELVARPTEEEAWREVEIGFANVSDGIRQTYGRRGGDSVGAARLQALGAGQARDYRDLIVSPNIWGGFSLLRPGPALGIVGSYENVAARLDDLIALGADAFILAATPHLEEAYRVGEEVLPLLGSPAIQRLEAAE